MSFGSFGTLRRKRQEDSEEYLCPMDVEMPQSSSFHRGLRVYEDELDQLEQARPMSQKKTQCHKIRTRIIVLYTTVVVY